MRRLYKYISVCLFLFALESFGVQPDISDPLSELAFKKSWINLIHYESALSGTTGWQSTIKSDDFFLDPNGRSDPLAELKATLAAFAASETSNPNQHAQCRFPARYLWLKANLPEHRAFHVAIKCPLFDEWTRSGSVSSISVVFASGYLGNPASFYGHTLLKFNFAGDNAQGNLMDVSVNYGALMDGTNDSMAAYIFKCIFGGYDGGFSHIRFYFHNHNYGDHELRDLWEYKLDLPKGAVDLIVAHSWEVLGKRFTYYFLRGNCADRLGELLQVVDGLNIIPENRSWTIPQAVIHKLSGIRYQNKPLLAEVKYYPSRQSRFYEKYSNLSPKLVTLLRELVAREKKLEDETFKTLPVLSKQAVLDALIDYYQFVGNPITEAPLEMKLAYSGALSARYELPPGLPKVERVVPPHPETARPPGWMQAGWAYNSALGHVFSVRARAAYYDELDYGSGHVPNSALGMGDLQIFNRSGQWYINNIAFFNVDSVSPGISGLPGDNGAAWKIRVGAEQHRLFCDHCLVARAQGDIGVGRQWNSSLFTAAFVGGAIQNNRADQGFGFTRASGTVIVKEGDRFAMKLDYERRFPLGAAQGSYGIAHAEARWLIDSTTDFRIGYDHDSAHQLSMGLGFYW